MNDNKELTTMTIFILFSLSAFFYSTTQMPAPGDFLTEASVRTCRTMGRCTADPPLSIWRIAKNTKKSNLIGCQWQCQMGQRRRQRRPQGACVYHIRRAGVENRWKGALGTILVITHISNTVLVLDRESLSVRYCCCDRQKAWVCWWEHPQAGGEARQGNTQAW